jgi:hypothetical protein
MFESLDDSSFRTAGVFLLYKNKYAFMIGPNRNGDKLGIVRLGGHIEENEGIVDCIKREVWEEARVDINIVSSPITYFKSSWEEKEFEVIEVDAFGAKPILIVNGVINATALYLATTAGHIVPSAEAHGIILLNEKEIVEICKNEITLSDFVSQGGELLQSQEMDLGFKLSAGPHLRFLYQLIDKEDGAIEGFRRRIR